MTQAAIAPGAFVEAISVRERLAFPGEEIQPVLDGAHEDGRISQARQVNVPGEVFDRAA